MCKTAELVSHKRSLWARLPLKVVRGGMEEGYYSTFADYLYFSGKIKREGKTQSWIMWRNYTLFFLCVIWWERSIEKCCECGLEFAHWKTIRMLKMLHVGFLCNKCITKSPTCLWMSRCLKCNVQISIRAVIITVWHWLFASRFLQTKQG